MSITLKQAKEIKTKPKIGVNLPKLQIRVSTCIACNKRQWKFCLLSANLTGSELVDQQGTSLRVLPAVKTIQLCGHLVQLFIGVIELGQELRVCPLHRNTKQSFQYLTIKARQCKWHKLISFNYFMMCIYPFITDCYFLPSFIYRD